MSDLWRNRQAAIYGKRAFLMPAGSTYLIPYSPCDARLPDQLTLSLPADQGTMRRLRVSIEGEEHRVMGVVIERMIVGVWHIEKRLSPAAAQVLCGQSLADAHTHAEGPWSVYWVKAVHLTLTGQRTLCGASIPQTAIHPEQRAVDCARCRVRAKLLLDERP